MKFFFNIIICVTLLSTTLSGFTQVTAPYQVGTWFNFKKSAITYTFDDGCMGQFTKAIPLFNEYNLPLTLFIVPNWISNWDNVQDAVNKGHEVANHSTTHANLSTLSIEELEKELANCNESIYAKVKNQKIVTMAYPYCATGDRTIHNNYFIAVRACQGYIEKSTPADFMNVSSVICGSQGPVKTANDFIEKANDAVQTQGWLVYLLHGVDNDGGYSPVPTDTLRRSLAYLTENDNDFWVATFGNVARYIKERDCVTITETIVSKNSITVSITDTLSNNEIFNHPLSITRPLPKGWKKAVVIQNGATIPYKIVEDNLMKYIHFNAVPDAGNVIISKK